MAEQMYHGKKVASILNISARSLERLRADPRMRAKLGAKKVSCRCWRYVARMVDDYANSLAN